MEKIKDKAKDGKQFDKMKNLLTHFFCTKISQSTLINTTRLEWENANIVNKFREIITKTISYELSFLCFHTKLIRGKKFYQKEIVCQRHEAFPGGKPIQVLTTLDAAYLRWSNENRCVQHDMAVDERLTAIFGILCTQLKKNFVPQNFTRIFHTINIFTFSLRTCISREKCRKGKMHASCHICAP